MNPAAALPTRLGKNPKYFEGTIRFYKRLPKGDLQGD